MGGCGIFCAGAVRESPRTSAAVSTRLVIWRRIDPGIFFYFLGLFFHGTGETVRPIWHRDLEPGSFARLASFQVLSKQESI